ncbi:hypothetical protein PybrP1_008938 [[Pythium] brassicae (nom. inval.)]|nr:hypothetical protein PybrP1_008938 [[Pythium] brassicae (nom. inval.)]
MIATCPSHPIHAAMKDAIKRACPSYSASDCRLVFAGWSSRARQRFAHANVAALPANVVTRQFGTQSDGYSAGLATFEATLNQLLAGVRSLSEEVVAIRSGMARMSERVEAVFDSATGIAEHCLAARLEARCNDPGHVARTTDATGERTQCRPQDMTSLTWLANLLSLAGISLAAVLYQYWHYNLGSVPYDRANHAQRDALMAVRIASTFVDLQPPPFSSLVTDEDRSRWRVEAQGLAARRQAAVLLVLNTSHDSTSRKRRLTGAVSGVLKAWTARRQIGPENEQKEQ